MRPVIWGLDVPQVQTLLPTHDAVIALAFEPGVSDSSRWRHTRR
jgi:hypothetical protein